MKKLSIMLLSFLLSCTSEPKMAEVIQDTAKPMQNFALVDSLSGTLSINSRRKAVKRIADSSLSIETLIEFPDGIARLKTVGSAIAIKHGKHNLILTAKHVSMAVDPTGSLYCSMVTEHCIKLPPRPLVELQIEFNINKDWAIYRVENFPLGVVPTHVSTKEVHLGDTIWLAGMPWGHHAWISKGVIAWKFNSGMFKGLYGVDGFAAGGSSGGGVFDIHGNLVALTVAVEIGSNGGPQENQVLAIPIRNVWVLTP